MITFQDLLNVGDDENARMSLCLKIIDEHKGSALFDEAAIAEEYDKQRNVTINQYQKLLYTISGAAVPDNYSANHKCASNFFHRFVTQTNQYLLGNGIAFEDKSVKDAIGGDSFDKALKKVGRNALKGAVSFGFYNLDHVEVFSVLEFAPLYDEETGALSAGVRFWQLASDKPLRFTLYEMDGYTEYMKKSGQPATVFAEKRPYILKVALTDSGEEILAGRNYAAFPIVPCYGINKQSMLVGMRENIDVYDLIKSGFANDVDDASLIYWTLQNAGGMDDVDLAKFVERMHTVKAAVVDGDAGATAEAHTLEVPSASREALLTRIENDLYRDAMVLNVNVISAGNVTATAINAAYNPQDDNSCDFEDNIVDFVDGILALAGYDENTKYTFKRNRIANQLEETQMVLSAGQFLDQETVVRHLPFLASDELDGILTRLTREESDRYTDDDENTADDETAAAENETEE